MQFERSCLMADIDNFISNKWKSIFVFLSVSFHNSKIKQVRKKKTQQYKTVASLQFTYQKMNCNIVLKWIVFRLAANSKMYFIILYLSINV